MSIKNTVKKYAKILGQNVINKNALVSKTYNLKIYDIGIVSIIITGFLVQIFTGPFFPHTGAKRPENRFDTQTNTFYIPAISRRKWR
jgi:hypothetical protein